MGKIKERKINNVYKQAIILRKDLKMGAGKSAVQAAHASLGCFIKTDGLPINFNKISKDWINTGQKKVCLKVNSEEELLVLHKKIKESGIAFSLITDSGLTEFHGIPTITALGVGPAQDSDIDDLTKHLKLY